jgi:hypothetical protein
MQTILEVFNPEFLKTGLGKLKSKKTLSYCGIRIIADETVPTKEIKLI